MSKQSEEVRKYFIINHIKQVEVAEKINLDKTTLSNILAGRRKFNEEIATALADAYGFDVAYLLTGRGSLVPSRPSRSAGDINNSTVTQGDNSPINIVADNAALEAEARAVIDRYATDTRLFPMPPKYRSYQSFLTAMDAALRSRAVRLGLPNVSCYWARHTFASLAFELGYGMDLVSAALGHSLGGARVTSTYVNIVDKQVDDLARAVYDYIAPSAHSGSVNDDSSSVPVGGSSR